MVSAVTRRAWEWSGWAGSAAGERVCFSRGESGSDSCLNPGGLHGLVSGFVPRLMESAVKRSETASGHRPVWEQILLCPRVQELERWDYSERATFARSVNKGNVSASRQLTQRAMAVMSPGVTAQIRSPCRPFTLSWALGAAARPQCARRPWVAAPRWGATGRDPREHRTTHAALLPGSRAHPQTTPRRRSWPLGDTDRDKSTEVFSQRASGGQGSSFSSSCALLATRPTCVMEEVHLWGPPLSSFLVFTFSVARRWPHASLSSSCLK